MDGVPPGTVAAFQGAVQKLISLNLRPPGPAPNPLSLEARMDAAEKNRIEDRKIMTGIADSVLQLQQLIKGK